MCSPSSRSFACGAVLLLTTVVSSLITSGSFQKLMGKLVAKVCILGHSKFHMQCLHPMLKCWPSLASASSVQLPAVAHGRRQRMAQVLGFLPPRERTGWSSWLLALAWLGSVFVIIWECNSRWKIFPSVSLFYSTFPMNAQINLQKTTKRYIYFGSYNFENPVCLYVLVDCLLFLTSFACFLASYLYLQISTLHLKRSSQSLV